MKTENKYFLRAAVKGDVLYSWFRFRDIEIMLDGRTGNIMMIEDQEVNELLARGQITVEQKKEYENRISELWKLNQVPDIDEYPVEQIYALLNRIRCEVLGAEVLECERKRQMQKEMIFCPQRGIDQISIKENLVEKASCVLFALTEARFFPLMKQEVEQALATGKKVHLVVSSEKGMLLPCREIMEKWFAQMDGIQFIDEQYMERMEQNSTVLLWFGEEGLFVCQNLSMDSVVYATPRGYHAQAVTGLFGGEKDVVVYIPATLNVAPYVPLIDRTRLNLYVLYALWKEHGMDIYSYRPEELYRKYPNAFVNMYGKSIPINVEFDGEEGDVFSCFDSAKEKGIQEFLGQFDNIKYISTYFEAEGIRVNGVRIKQSEKAEVIPCKNKYLQEMFAERASAETAVLSNFMFFMTKKLVKLYNDLREDRPEEQSEKIMGHLDYQLEYREGKRVETFPLFNKGCIAMKNTGEVIMFQFRLGGGSVSLGNTSLCWQKGDVDPAGKEVSSEICVFTPNYSMREEGSLRETYRKFVGENRLNFVIYQEEILCCRMGDVILPSVGVVVSVEKDKGEKLIGQLGLVPLGNGYYDTGQLSFSVELDKPEDVSDEDWVQVKWAYGGGLSLISNGETFADKEHFGDWVAKEGWTSPLSRQTQESDLQNFAKHPRTAIGTAKDGSLIILVFSGRTQYSRGADYGDMVDIAKKLFPDIQYLMNVDGGGSAVLGLVHEGAFVELNIPCTTRESMVGMARPVKTVLYIPINKSAKEEWNL